MQEIEQLAEALRRNPEQAAVLRGLLLGAEPALADTVRALADAQLRTEQRVDALTEQMAVLTARVDALTEQMAVLTRRVDALTEQMTALTSQVSTLATHVAWLRGDALERRYRERANAYLGRVARRLRPVPVVELEDLLERAVADGTFTDREADEVRWADAVLRGRRRSDGAESYVVVEASVGVGLGDVDRAWRRAELMGRTGLPALAVVAGEWINAEAQEAADSYGVWQVTDGRVVAPPSAA